MTGRELWQDYLFLTNEIEKFLIKQDFDMVNELLKQREKIQRIIDSNTIDGFNGSAAGQKLFQELTDKNRHITQMLHLLRNRSQKKHTVANAYDRLGMTSTGRMMDSKS